MREDGVTQRWNTLTRRVLDAKLARAALAVLWLLFASAIYAPIVANDEPLYLRAVDRGACEQALATLEPLVEEWALALVAGDPSAANSSLAPAREAVLLRIETLRAFAPHGELANQLELVETHMDEASSQFQSRGIHGASAGVSVLRILVARTRTELALDTLVSVRSAPALESLSRLDVFAMWLMPTLTVFVLFRRLRHRAWIPIATAVAMAALWPFVFVAEPLASRPCKAAIESGALVVESAWFTPIPFAFDESNASEVLRPPTALASSEIDDEGRYLRGPRRIEVAPRSDFAPAIKPVRVLPYEPARNSPWRHLLGTDSLGRDLLARLLWGARTSLFIGVAGAALVLAIGIVIGALAGWFGRAIDALLSRAIETTASFPAIFVIVVVAALIPTSALDPRLSIPLVVGLLGWTGIARLTRGEVLRVKALDHVAAARVLGFSDARIIVRHVLPNALQPVIVAGAFLVGWAIFVEASVSFLGFGVEAPAPSWGNLLDDSREWWWVQVFPGTAIALTVLAFHLLGESLRDALDPRLSRVE